MALIEENNCTKKVNIVLSVIGGVVVCIALVFMAMSNTGLSFSINDFIDLPSLISIVLVEIGVVLISRARTKEKVLQLLSKTILSVGLLNSIISMIFAFMQTMHGDIHMMGVCLAIAVLPLLYSVIVKIAVEILLTMFKEVD